MKSNLFRGLLIAVVAPLLLVGGFAFTGLLTDPKDATVITDTLTGTLDSTAVFPWNGSYMTVTVGPGYNDSSYFTKAGATVIGYDSVTTRFYIRGWADRGRKTLISQTGVWGYATPFLSQKPTWNNIWKAIALGKQDSTTRFLFTSRESFFKAGPVTSNDSTDFYYGNGQNYGSNYILVPYAPYYDIVKSDSTGLCGYGHRAKLTIAQYRKN